MAGTVIHVDDDNCPGPGSGTAGDPYCSIQSAIDAAVDTDEIIVARGTYFEMINFFGKAITVRSTDPSDPAVVASHDHRRRGIGSVVTCNSGEGPTSVLAGLLITGGNAFDGGGMHIGARQDAMFRELLREAGDRTRNSRRV